jgi:hypothetical protein
MSGKPNSRLPCSSTTESATNRARMLRVLVRTSRPLRWMTSPSNASRSAPVSPRTSTVPPHSGTSTCSVTTSCAARMLSLFSSAVFFSAM